MTSAVRFVRTVLCVVGGILLAFFYALLEEMFLSQTAFANPGKYKHANDWFGLDFLLDIPIGTVMLAPIFVIALLKLRAAPMRCLFMLIGVAVAGVLYPLLTASYVPADRSLENEVPLALVLAWGVVSVVCAWVGYRVPRGSARPNTVG